VKNWNKKFCNKPDKIQTIENGNLKLVGEQVVVFIGNSGS